MAISTAPAPAAPAPTPISIPTGPGAGSVPTPAADASFDAAFKDLDDLSPKPTPPAEPAAPAAPEPPKPEPPKVEKKPSIDDFDEHPDPATEKVPAFKTNKELRTWAEKQQKLAEEKAKVADEKAKEVDRLAERLKTLEASPRDTSKEESAIKERLAVLEKQLTERDAELSSIRWETSAEYKEKYEQPFVDAASEAYEAVSQLFIVGKNEEGEEVQVRPATGKDFQEVYYLPYGQAYQKAKELFGDLAGPVMQHYAIVKGLDRKRSKAVQDHRATAVQREQEATARRAVEQEGMTRQWQMVNDHISKKYPFFGPVDGDADGNDLLAKGFAMVDPAFTNRESLSPQQRLVLDARIRNQAAAFPRERRRVMKLETKVAELEKELAGFRASTPGPEKRPAGSGPPTTENLTWQQQLDAIPG